MIRSQRRRHLFVWLALGPLILVGLAAGLWARQAIPTGSGPPGPGLVETLP